MPNLKLIIATLFIVLVFGSPARSQSKEFRSLLAKARAGNVDAQNEVGIAYSEGKGVKPNQKKAVYWFRMGAEKGYAIATCNVALHYSQGWGVKRNITLMWKYVFAAHALDGLKCNPGDVPPKLRKHCSMERGWELTVAWLRAHPDFKNNFGDKPWMSETEEYPITVRTSGDSMQLPVKPAGKCRQTRKLK
jgi:TPR repeat protein